MKRIFILILSLFMLISLFVACAEEANDTGDASSNAVSDDEESTGGAVSDETSENVVFDPTPRELEYSYKLLNVKSMPDEMRGYTVLSIEKFKQLIIESREDLDELIGWMGNNNADSDAAMYFNALPDNYFDEKTLLVTDYTDFAYNERSVSSVYANENGVTVIYSTVFNGNEIIEVGPDPAFMVVELSKKDILGCENFNAIADINDNSIAELEENREILYYNGEYDFENAPERSETGVFEQYTDIPNPLAEYFADNEDSDSAFFLVGLDIDCEDETLVSHKLRQSGFIAAPLKYYPEETSHFSYVGFIKKSGYEALSENESFSTGITWLSNSTNVSGEPDTPDTPDEPDEYDPTPRDLEYTYYDFTEVFTGFKELSNIDGYDSDDRVLEVDSYDVCKQILTLNKDLKGTDSSGTYEFLNGLDKDYFSEKTVLLLEISEPQVGYKHEVTNVHADESGITVSVKFITPEIGADMICYHVIVVELDESDVLGCEDYTGLLHGVCPD